MTAKYSKTKASCLHLKLYERDSFTASRMLRFLDKSLQAIIRYGLSEATIKLDLCNFKIELLEKYTAIIQQKNSPFKNEELLETNAVNE